MQFLQCLKADSRRRLISNRRARDGVKHPLRDQTMRAIGHNDHETVDMAAATSLENLHFLAMKRVVMVLDSPHLGNVSTLYH